eukprot:jgi/Bigna1/59012/fgenesh1_kg.2_\
MEAARRALSKVIVINGRRLDCKIAKENFHEKSRSQETCHKCGQLGHFIAQCPWALKFKPKKSRTNKTPSQHPQSVSRLGCSDSLRADHNLEDPLKPMDPTPLTPVVKNG